MPKSVYPRFNGPNVQFVPGIPAVPHLGIGEEEAEWLVSTGAFTYDKPPPSEADTDTEAPETPGPSDSPQE